MLRGAERMSAIIHINSSFGGPSCRFRVFFFHDHDGSLEERE